MQEDNSQVGMAPNLLFSNMSYEMLQGPKKNVEKDITDPQCTNKNKSEAKLQIVWKNVLIFIILHSISVYSIFMLLTFQFKFSTVIFTYLNLMFAGFGITAGAHRLWAHRSYTANLPLRIFLMIAQSAALQNDIHEWVRDHRVHHKFTDTNADPHNASRGFFFSHIGWLMTKKHPDVLNKGKNIDMSDVLADPVVKFQMRFYVPLVIVCNFIVPTFIPWYFLGEDGYNSFILCIGRYVISLNGTWLVNSAAHIWGMKPYDKNIKPTENKFVAIVAFGEGWHNYHHIFPWDYKAAELGNYRLNFTTCFLDFMARIGWATDLKTASEEIINKRIQRTGDSHKRVNGIEDHHHDEGEAIWGWGDKDMNKDEVLAVTRMTRQKA
ncbi:unnamed protein product [Ceutorhynchus assimilis]|uniref:Fatty acid desaturase domain-containing protein n=1 Tax=Ceutorhynchus assimilis TaxID=467358 RepID=A0A9N9QMJ6_9CUCU|nr:unnamed protein product [Ceutorhynchus assimilis]